MEIRNQQDFWSGALFIAFGLGFAIYGQVNYDFGIARRMGPGFFPVILGFLLAAIGAIVLVKSLTGSAERTPLPKFSFGAVAWVLGSVVLFALVLPWLGMLLSIALLVVVSMLGSHEFRWKEAAGVMVVMVVIVYGVFIYGLKMTVPVLPPFLVS